MKENPIIVTIVLLLALLVFSCESVIYEIHSSDKFVSMTTPKYIGEYKVVGKLNYRTKAAFILLQLITIKDANIDKAIQKQVMIYKGDGIINLEINEQYDAFDWMLFMLYPLTAIVVSTRSISVTGDIIKLNPASTTGAPDMNNEIKLAILDYNSGANR